MRLHGQGQVLSRPGPARRQSPTRSDQFAPDPRRPASGLSPADVVALQRSAGNRAVASLLVPMAPGGPQPLLQRELPWQSGNLDEAKAQKGRWAKKGTDLGTPAGQVALGAFSMSVVPVAQGVSTVDAFAGSMTGGASSAATGPVSMLLGTFAAQKHIRRSYRAGRNQAQAKSFGEMGDKWQQAKAGLEAEVASLRQRPKLSKRQTKKLAAKEEQIKLLQDDINALAPLGPAYEAMWKTKVAEEASRKGQAYNRSVHKKADQLREPDSLAEIVGYYWNQKRKAHWRSALEGTGAALGVLGSGLATIGAALAIAGAAGMGFGAIPGLVVGVVGGALSLLGVATSLPSILHKGYRWTAKKVNKVKGQLRHIMARAFLMYLNGTKGSEGDRLEAAAFASRLGIPGLSSIKAVRRAVANGQLAADDKLAERVIAQKFRSTKGG